MLLPDGSPRLGKLPVQAVHLSSACRVRTLERIIGQVSQGRGEYYLRCNKEEA